MILIHYYNLDSDILVVKNDKVLKVTRSSMNRILDLTNKPEIKTELIRGIKDGNIYKISRKQNGN